MSSGTLRGEGHFENVDRTLRSGVETGVNYERGGRFSAFATYTLQRAVFGTDLVLASQFHPLAMDTEIPVADGSSLPGVPRHTRKFGLAARLLARLDAGFTVRAQSEHLPARRRSELARPGRDSPSPTRTGATA